MVAHSSQACPTSCPISLLSALAAKTDARAFQFRTKEVTGQQNFGILKKILKL